MNQDQVTVCQEEEKNTKLSLTIFNYIFFSDRRLSTFFYGNRNQPHRIIIDKFIIVE
jgi:hypothetical protein